jgi:nicotinamidase-related amidase
MLTLFTCPKSFDGHIAVIQRNAIQSWKLLSPQPEIVLFGDDAGVADAAKTYGAVHCPAVLRNEFSTPLVNSIFETAEKLASRPLRCYINSDIILTQEFMDTVSRVNDLLSQFLLVGSRFEANVQKPINYESDWRKWIEPRVYQEQGRNQYALDYFVFNRNVWKSIPPFAIGRFFWDLWLLEDALKRGVKTIDISQTAITYHQMHNYSHIDTNFGISRRLTSPEVRRNLELCGGSDNQPTLQHVRWIYTAQGLQLKCKNSSRHLGIRLRTICRKLETKDATAGYLIGSVRKWMRNVVCQKNNVKNWFLNRRISVQKLKANQCALVIVDLWDQHWHPQASKRIAELATRIDVFARQLRQRGVLIIHAPSDTDYYEGSDARERAFDIHRVFPFNFQDWQPSKPMPFVAPTWVPNTLLPWSKQHDAVMIDHEKDVISAHGPEIHNVIMKRGIKVLLFVGVHSNECIFNSRSFSIPKMHNNGVQTVLVQDMVDGIIDDKDLRITSWDEANRIIAHYYAKYVCPVMSSNDVLSKMDLNVDGHKRQ